MLSIHLFVLSQMISHWVQ